MEGAAVKTITCFLFGHASATRVEARPAGHGRYEAWQTCSRCLRDHKVSAPGGLLTRTILHGHMLPRGYGVAWMHWDKPSAVAMPIPLNLVVGALRRAWCWVKAPDALFNDSHAAYRAGLQEGRRQAGSVRPTDD
jgi:hypothetical protein